MKMFRVLISMTAVFLASNVPMTSARANCYDGRLCECQRYMPQPQYDSIKIVIDCLNEFGVQHDFSKGSRAPTGRHTCEFYSPSNINNVSLRKCAFRKAGFIVNINGVEQWRLEEWRNALIRSSQTILSSPNDRQILNLYLNALRTCTHNPTDFGSIPFLDCLNQVEAWIIQNLSNEKESVQSLSASDRNGGKLLGSSNVDELINSVMTSPDS